MTPGLSQGSKGSILSTLEAEKLKGGAPEEDPFGQFWASLCGMAGQETSVSMSPGGTHSGGQGRVSRLFNSTPSSHFIPASCFLRPTLNS